MKYIFQLIVIISIGYFMYSAHITNWREHKRYIEELRQEGKLASPRTRILRALKAYGVLIGMALIITIGVNYVRKLGFSMQSLFWGTLLFFCLECIIGGICSFIRDMIQTYKKEGVLVAILSFIFIIGISVGIVYVRYNW